MRGRTASLVTVVATTLALTLAGCSGDPAETTGPNAPQLAAALTRVDSALAAHEFAKARTRLERLISAAESAREAGTMDADEAQQIIDAATRLLGLLPDPTPTASTSPTAKPATSTQTSKPAKAKKKHGHGKKDDRKHDRKPGEKHPKKRSKKGH